MTTYRKTRLLIQVFFFQIIYLVMASFIKDDIEIWKKCIAYSLVALGLLATHILYSYHYINICSKEGE